MSSRRKIVIKVCFTGKNCKDVSIALHSEIT